MSVLFSSEEATLNLVVLERQNPSEHLAYLVEEQKFEAAMKMAELSGLPKEGIYKAMWKTRGNTPIGSSDLDAVMEHIRDRRWILGSCEEAVGRSFVDQQNIVTHGRNIAEELFRENCDDEKNVDLYLKWMHITEVLETFRALHPGAYSVDAYRQFRSKPLRVIAKDFAKSGNIRALQVLFRHHSHSVFDSLLTILEELPCTMPPRLCKEIYPRIRMTPSTLGYNAQKHIDLLQPLKDLGIDINMLSTVEYQPDVLLAHMRMKGPSEMPHLTENQIHLFYSQLAQHIEKATGNLSMAREALQLGIRNGAQQLTHLLDQLTIFEAWMSIGNAFWDWDVESFNRLSISERIDRCLQSIDDDDLPDWIKHQMTILMKTLPRKEKAESRESFIQYLLQRKAEVLQMVMSEVCLDGDLFDADAHGLQECIHAVVKAVEVIDKVDDWDAVYLSLRTLKQRATSFRSLDVTDLENVTNDCHVGALLQRHGMHLPYARLRQLSPSDTERLIKGVLGHAMRSGGQWSDLQWNTVFSDCTIIAQIIDKDNDIEKVKLDYFRTLLRACKFDLAESFMDDELDPSTAEDIAWTVGREILCSLTDLDSLNIIDKAKQCFDLFPSSQRARHEIQKLKTLTFVRSNFGIILLPVELETPGFESDLIDRILNKNEKQYRKREALQTVCNELNFDDDAFYEAWQKLCHSALRFHDLRSAMDLMKDLRERNIGRSWKLAMDIVEEDRCQEYLNLDDKETLWSFIVVHCDDGLQGCIEQMRQSLTKPDVTVALEETDRLDSADAYWYYADVEYRETTKALKQSTVEQKCSVYEFVYGALVSVDNIDSQTAAFVRKLLESSPQEITELLKMHPEYLKASQDDRPDVPSFEENLATLKEHDQLRSSFRLIQSVLPGLDASRFCEADNDVYRKNIVLELAGYAGELFYRRSKDDRHLQEMTMDPTDVLKMAMEQGNVFSVDGCTVHGRFVTALCSLVDGPFEEMETAVMSSEDILTSQHDRDVYIQQIMKDVWPGIVNRYAVAFIVRTCMRCLPPATSSDTTIQLLKTYAENIAGMNHLRDFDFRIPICSVMSQLTSEHFGCDVHWKPEISEMQNIYVAVSTENWPTMHALYEIVNTETSIDDRPTASSVRLCSILKQLHHLPWPPQFTEKIFWKEAVATLQQNHLDAIVDYLVFGNPTLLSTVLSSLDASTTKEIASWKPTSSDDSHTITVFMTLLEQSIERREIESVSDQISHLEKWKEELKRLRRLQAMQGLSGMGVEITGSDYESNVRQLTRKMVMDGKSYLSVFEAVLNFARRSGENASSEIIHQTIAAEIKQLTIEGIRDDGDCLEAVLLCLEDADEDISIKRLQEEVWHQCLIQYKELSERSERDHDRYDLIQMMISIIQKDVWPKRQWTISGVGMWSIFSWSVHHTLQTQNTDQQYPELLQSCFMSEDDTHAMLKQELSKEVAIDAVLHLLDALSSNASLMEMEVASEWLCPYYAEVFQLAIRRRDPWTVLKYLSGYTASGWQFPILTEESATMLLKDFKKMSLQLWVCLGLLLPSPSLRHEALGMVASIEGSVDILAVLLRSQPDFEYHDLMTSPSWLSSLTEECPPHHSLLPLWISKSVTDVTNKGKEKTEHGREHQHKYEVTSPAGSEEGWDIDDDLGFEIEQTEEVQDVDPDASTGWSDVDALPFEQPEEPSNVEPGSPGGWSDVDELETALQSVHDPQSPSSTSLTSRLFLRSVVGTKQEKDVSDAGKDPDVDDEEGTSKDPGLHETNVEAIEDALSTENRLFAGACCFPMLLALLITKGQVDITLRLISRKMQLHSLADRYTSGRLLLERFMKAMTERPLELSDMSRTLLESRWTAVILRDLLDETPMLCRRAIVVLESNN